MSVGSIDNVLIRERRSAFSIHGCRNQEKLSEGFQYYRQSMSKVNFCDAQTHTRTHARPPTHPPSHTCTNQEKNLYFCDLDVFMKSI
jgi:hypothetical protein